MQVPPLWSRSTTISACFLEMVLSARPLSSTTSHFLLLPADKIQPRHHVYHSGHFARKAWPTLREAAGKTLERIMSIVTYERHLSLDQDAFWEGGATLGLVYKHQHCKLARKRRTGWRSVIHILPHGRPRRMVESSLPRVIEPDMLP